jgi:hypothetical protein
MGPGESTSARGAARTGNTADQRAEESEHRAAWAVAGGLSLAAGASAIGIGMGHWKAPAATAEPGRLHGFGMRGIDEVAPREPPPDEPEEP